jgi:hypothetical protein
MSVTPERIGIFSRSRDLNFPMSIVFRSPSIAGYRIRKADAKSEETGGRSIPVYRGDIGVPVSRE